MQPQTLTRGLITEFNDLERSWRESTDKWDDDARVGFMTECWEPLWDAVNKQEHDLDTLEKSFRSIERVIENLKSNYVRIP